MEGEPLTLDQPQAREVGGEPLQRQPCLQLAEAGTQAVVQAQAEAPSSAPSTANWTPTSTGRATSQPGPGWALVKASAA
jgi:hypothetical protein